MRPMTLGRKNWLFCGSDSGGDRAAAIYSLTETAKLNALDPEDYLRQVLERSPNIRSSGSMNCCRGTSPVSGQGSISARRTEPDCSHPLPQTDRRG